MALITSVCAPSRAQDAGRGEAPGGRARQRVPAGDSRARSGLPPTQCSGPYACPMAYPHPHPTPTQWLYPCCTAHHCSSLLITAHSLRSNANSSSPCHGAAPLVCSPTGQSTTTPRSQVHSPLTRPCRCCCTPRLPLVGVSIGMERGRQQNDTCTRRSQPSPPSWRRSFGRITTGQHPTHPRHATPRHTLCTCPCPPAHAVHMPMPPGTRCAHAHAPRHTL